ncbi:hypothetical protein SQ11_10390 [Nitrosospira sp. NpAV]|nr:hypothetical protein SQ11_10390 [Nitrosospira sp. NpAV]
MTRLIKFICFVKDFIFTPAMTLYFLLCTNLGNTYWLITRHLLFNAGAALLHSAASIISDRLRTSYQFNLSGPKFLY